ncbi:MAG TPA: hypothetical protein VHZ76_07190 [Gammaproteobacteria bacterium]|nr:hypothetical protein [Gammaproteobacteria bacterium]
MRNKKFSINITNKEEEIIVSILKGKRWKRFKNEDTGRLIADINQSFQLI